MRHSDTLCHTVPTLNVLTHFPPHLCIKFHTFGTNLHPALSIYPCSSGRIQETVPRQRNIKFHMSPRFYNSPLYYKPSALTRHY